MDESGYGLKEICIDCGNQILFLSGYQEYCRNCERAVQHIQLQSRVLPKPTQSSTFRKRKLEKQRKLNTLIREFTSKYRKSATPEEAHHLRTRLEGIKQSTPYEKGSREAAAVVVYFSLEDNIKPSIKQFCQENKLSIKAFNRKYKIYHRIYKSQSLNARQSPLDTQNELGSIKIEQKIDESSTALKIDLEEIRGIGAKPTNSIKHHIGTRDGLQLVFDDIFKKSYFQQRKQMIIDKLVRNFQEINENVYALINYNDSQPLKFYCLLYTIIKSLQMAITYEKYSQIVKNRTGIQIKKKTINEIKTIYQMHENERKESSQESSIREASIKMQDQFAQKDNIDDWPRIIVENESEFSQEYYSP